MITPIRALFFLALFACSVRGATGSSRPLGPIEIDFLYGRDELFPSVLVSLTGSSEFAPQDPAQLGDPRGVMATRVVAPAKDCTVRVTIAATPFFAESSVSVILPNAGSEYRIAPTIRYNNEKLAAVKQPVPNLVIKVSVVFDPGGPQEVRQEVYRRITVHDIHECVLGYRLRGHRAGGQTQGIEMVQTPLLLAAYVNENHPVLDQKITKQALRRPDPLVQQFIGYLDQGGIPLIGVTAYVPGVTRSVRTEVHAIYDSLRRMGFRYADLGAPPNAAEAANGVVTRSVRLVGEIVESRQANELEVATVIASVLRKLSVDTVLFVLPERRALLGVFLTRGRDWSHLLVLDPQYLGTERSFDDAVEFGAKAYASYRAHLGPAARKAGAAPAGAGGSKPYFTIDLEDARRSGVLPIPERR